MEPSREPQSQHIELMTQKLLSVCNTFTVFETSSSVMGYRFDLNDFENYIYKDYSLKCLYDVLIKIDESDRQHVIDSSIYQLFSLRAKHPCSKLYGLISWILEKLGLSKLRFIYNFSLIVDICSNNVKIWKEITAFLLENYRLYENKDFRKLFFVIMDKTANYKERSPCADNTVKDIVNFMMSVIEDGLIPRILVFNQLCKSNFMIKPEQVPSFQNCMTKIFESFNGLKSLVTMFKRSTYIPLDGLSNLNDIIWGLDHKTFLFKNPVIHNHFHNQDFKAPEYGYVETIFMKYQKFDPIFTILGLNSTQSNVSIHFYHSLTNVLDKLALIINNEPICTDFDYSALQNVLVLPFYRVVSMASLRNLINVADLFHYLKQYTQTRNTSDNMKSIVINLISESLSMSRTGITSDHLVDIAHFLNYIYSTSFNSVEDCLEKKSLFRGIARFWKQTSHLITNDCLWLRTMVPESVSAVLKRLEWVNLDNIVDLFSPTMEFYVNLYSNRNQQLNTYYSQLFKLYSIEKVGVHHVKLPHNLSIQIHPENFNVNKGFFMRLKEFPLTQFLVYMTSTLNDNIDQDNRYVISPPLLEILYLLTLGEMGNNYRFQHNLVVIFAKCVTLKAYNCLNVILEMFTYNPLPKNNLKLSSMILRMTLGLENICCQLRQLSVSVNTLILSLMMRFPKHDQMVSPLFFDIVYEDKIKVHFPDIQLLFIWHIIHSLNIAGYKQDCPSHIVNYIKNSFTDLPHTWSEAILSKCPMELKKIYEDVVDFKTDDIRNSIESLKKIINQNNNDNYVHLVQGTLSHQRMIMCLVLDRLTGELIDDRYILCMLKKTIHFNMIHALRYMIYYITIKEPEFQSSGTARILDALEEMVWDLHILTFDQLLISFVIFYCRGDSSCLIINIIVYLISSPRLKKAIEIFNNLQENVSSPLDQLESNAKFYNMVPEFYDFSKIDLKFNYIEERPTRNEPLVVYKSNLIYRLSFYVDMLVSRSLQSSENYLFMLRILKGCKTLLKYHPNVVNSLAILFANHPEVLSHEKNYAKVLIKKYLKYKFSSIGYLYGIFSEFFIYTMDSKAVNTILDPHTHILSLISRISESIPLNSFEAYKSYGATLEEFDNNHTLQYLTCAAIETVILMNRSMFVNVTVSLYFDFNFIYQDSIIKNIHPEYYIQTFGMLFAIMPITYKNECITILASNFYQVTQNSTTKLDPDFINFDQTLTYDQYSPHMILLLLLRSYFYHIPIGYLLDLPSTLATHFMKIINNEFQFILLTMAIVPSLKRLDSQINCRQIILNLCQLFGMVLINIDKGCPIYKFPHLISDFFYLMKYTFLGDAIQEQFNNFKTQLRPDILKYLYLI